MAPRTPVHKFDPLEQYRTEIQDRTSAGETCEQIAAAMRAKGIDITNKTISRRRLEWGLRKRVFSKLAGRVQKPRPKRANTQTAKGVARKAEIEARTQHGETAEQIAEALIAQGYELKNGSSTILRLQTFWGLIPHDPNRTRGKKNKSKDGTPKKAAGPPKVTKKEKSEMEREANRQQQTQTLHYPTNCSFGPKKRANAGLSTEDGGGEEFEDDSNEDDYMAAPDNDDYAPTTGPMEQQTVSVATEIMSVEFLVDLANSTLAAATNLKDMLHAYQSQTPAASSRSVFPPTLDDLTTARRKVREAAAVMHDLAAEPTTSGAES